MSDMNSIHIATLTHNYPSLGVVAVIDPTIPLAGQLRAMIIADGYDPEDEKMRAPMVEAFGEDLLPEHEVCWWLADYDGDSSDVQANRAAAEAMFRGWKPGEVLDLTDPDNGGDGLYLQPMRVGDVGFTSELVDG